MKNSCLLLKKILLINFFLIPNLINAEDDLFDDLCEEIEEKTNPEHFISENKTRLPKDVTLSALTGFNAQNSLLTELYQHTHQPLSRSSLDLPTTQIFNINFNNQTSLSASPFFSSIISQNFTKDSQHLNSYLDLEIPNIIQSIDDYQFLTFDVLNVLKLFHPIKIQEHTLGFMFNWIKTSEDYAYTISTPFSYILNNFYLTSEEQKRISEHPVFSEFTGDITEFIKRHCISDRLGIGDTEISIERLMDETHKGSYSLGAKLTIPTAFAFKKGLLGTHFNAQIAPSTLDVYSDLIDPALTNTSANLLTIQKKVSDFGYATMDRLATMLLERNMGDNYHWSLGLFMRSQMNFNDKFSFLSKMNFDLKLPSVNKRFFLLEPKIDEFNSFNWDENSLQVEKKIEYFNNQITNIFFPRMYFATIFPGFKFHSTSCLKRYVDAGRWSPSIGTDFWFNSKEHFIDINAPEDILKRINKEKYARKSAMTSSIWLAFERPSYEKSPWSFSYKTYFSIMNAGFGDALGMTLKFERNF